MLEHLETHCLDKEGLLRIPGSTARVNSLLLDLEENFHYGQFSFSCIKESDICSLLKQLIRYTLVGIRDGRGLGSRGGMEIPGRQWNLSTKTTLGN